MRSLLLYIIVALLVVACDKGKEQLSKLTPAQSKHVAEFKKVLTALVDSDISDKDKLRYYVGAIDQKTIDPASLAPLSDLFHQLFESENEDDRVSALTYLNAIKPDKYLELLQTAASDKSSLVRRHVAQLLADYPQEKTQAILVNLLNDKDRSVKYMAAKGFSDPQLLPIEDRKKIYIVKNSYLKNVTYVGHKPVKLDDPLQNIVTSNYRFPDSDSSLSNKQEREKLYNIVMEKGEALHQLIYTGNLNEIINLDKNSDLSAIKGRYNTGILTLAALSGQDHIVEYFIDKGASLEEKDVSGNTPLFRAITAGNISTVKLLIKRGANINYTSILGETVLTKAVSSQNEGMVRILLSLGADIDRPANHDADSESDPLWAALKMESPGMVALLIALGANVDSRDRELNSPLHSMINTFKLYSDCCSSDQIDESNQYTHVINKLIEKSKSVIIKNQNGFTPRELLDMKFHRIINGLESKKNVNIYKVYYEAISNSLKKKETISNLIRLK